MKRIFAPGCALMLYKPGLAKRLHTFRHREVRLIQQVSLHMVVQVLKGEKIPVKRGLTQSMKTQCTLPVAYFTYLTCPNIPH